MKYDVAIIGLGPSGIEFAKCASKMGLKVIAFEKSSVGGTCLNLGCIPTKTMLSCAEVFSKVNCCAKFGIQHTCNSFTFSYESMCEKRDKIVAKLSTAVLKDLQNRGVEIVFSKAVLKCANDKAKIIADGIEYEADKIIAATGSRPYELSGFEFNSDTILNSDDLLKMKRLPKSILIVGSGAIGIEWARILSIFGVSVSVVEKAPNAAPLMDLDISARMERIFKISKIKFYKNAVVESFSDGIAKLSDGQEVSCEKILCAVGRVRVYPEFCDDFRLEVRDNCKTNLKNLYVVGDASGEKMLAHVASYQARALFGELYLNKPYSIPHSPSVIYGVPEAASIGINEQDIPLESKQEYKIHKLPVSYLPKAWCDDEIDGFIKIIVHNNKIAGAHIVSKEASALIMQIAIAIKANMSPNDLKDVIFAHPTYSEGILEVLENG